jgi:hypothetical protein
VHEFFKFVGDNIWWVFIFGGGIFGWIGERFDAMRRRGQRKRRHQIALKRLDLQIAQAKAQSLPLPAADVKPGKCVHRNVTQVMSDDKVVAWLCKSCDAQLPADWAVRKEDL